MAKKAKTKTARAKGFQPGNTAATGGRREGSGRKPAAVRQAREAYFLGKFEAADGIIDRALDPRDRTVPWPEKIKVAIWIKEGVYGKHAIRMEIAEDSSAVRHMLEAAGAAKVAAIGEAHRKDSSK